MAERLAGNSSPGSLTRSLAANAMLRNIVYVKVISFRDALSIKDMLLNICSDLVLVKAARAAEKDEGLKSRLP